MYLSEARFIMFRIGIKIKTQHKAVDSNIYAPMLFVLANLTKLINTKTKDICCSFDLI